MRLAHCAFMTYCFCSLINVYHNNNILDYVLTNSIIGRGGGGGGDTKLSTNIQLVWSKLYAMTIRDKLCFIHVSLFGICGHYYCSTSYKGI